MKISSIRFVVVHVCQVLYFKANNSTSMCHDLISGGL